MRIEEYIPELFADVLEDIIVQKPGDSAVERFKSIFSPDSIKERLRYPLINPFFSAISSYITLQDESVLR